MRDKSLILVYASGPAAALGVLWLERMDLLADTPYLVLLAILFSTSVLNLGARFASSRWTPRSRMHLRLAASAITTAAATYAAGWGAFLVIVFAVGIADVMRTEGSAAWMPGLAWSGAAIIVAEAAVQSGIAPSLVSAGASHAVAVSGVCCLGLVVYTLGASAGDAEQSRERIRVDREQFRDLVQNARDVIALVGDDDIVRYISPGVRQLLGRSPEECAGSTFTTLMGSADAIAYQDACHSTEALHSVELELQFCRSDGVMRRVVTTVTTRSDGSRVVNLHDVSAERALEERLREQATIDTLTGLPNRHAIMDRLTLLQQQGPMTILFIDLDGFKEVNDALGHEAGDKVLIDAAVRIASSIPADTIFGRLGGDEFLAARPGESIEAALASSQRIVDSLRAPWDHLQGMHVGASVGIAINGRGEDIDTTIRRADAAMYEAKSQLDSPYRIVFATSMDATTRGRPSA